jgi:hypothetical protein
MMRRRLGLALAPVLAWLLLAFPARAVETDIRGWEGLNWGMTAQQVESALPRAVPLSPPWDVVVGGIAFDLVPELARKDDRLVQILFERRPPIPGPDELQSFVNDLYARLGPPAESCVVQSGLVTRVWRFPSAQVALTAVDFSADGSRGRLQRLLLRYTAADRAPPSPCERNKPRP